MKIYHKRSVVLLLLFAFLFSIFSSVYAVEENPALTGENIETESEVIEEDQDPGIVQKEINESKDKHDETENAGLKLKDIKVNGKSIENFDKDVFSYDITLPADTKEVPEVIAIAEDSNARVYIDKPDDFDKKRQAIVKITVKPDDERDSKSYKINFTVAKKPKLVTDLKDGLKVSEDIFRFNAKAFNSDDEELPIIVKINDEVIKGEKGNYITKLNHGKNEIIISIGKMQEKFTIIYAEIVNVDLNKEIALKGNSILKTDEGIEIDLSNAKVKQGAKIKIEDITDNPKYTPPADEGIDIAGKIINLSLEGIKVSVRRPIKITLPVNEEIDINKSSIYYFNEDNNTWDYCDSKRENGYLTYDATCLSTYGVFTDKKPPEDVKVRAKEIDAEEVELGFSAKDYSGIKEYHIYRDDFEDGPIAVVNDDVYTDVGLERDSEYEYKIKAVDFFGNISEFSPALTVRTAKKSKQELIEEEEQEVSVYMRVEGYERTIVPRTRIKVSLFNLCPYLRKGTGETAKPTGDWDVDKFEKPTHAHAIIKLLERRNIDYDFQDYGWGLYIAMIDGEREFDHGGMSGWMYRVNDEMPSIGCQGMYLREGDEIVWYYGAYGFDNIYTKMQADRTEVDVDEEVTIHLDGYYGGFNTRVRDLDKATILVDDKEFEVDGEIVKTDKNGNAVLKFSRPGRYTISAVRYRTKGGKDEYIETIRPVPITITVRSKRGIKEEDELANEDYQEFYDIVLDSKSSESDIVDAVKDAKNVFAENHKNISSENGAKRVINDARDLYKIISNASEKVEKEEAIESILDVAKYVMNITIKALKYAKDTKYKEKATSVIEDFIDNSLKLFERIDNLKVFKKRVSDILDTAISTKHILDKKKSKAIIRSVASVVRENAENCGVCKIGSKNLKMDKDKTSIEISKDDIVEVVKKIISKVNIVEDVFRDKNIKPNKKIDKKLVLEIKKLKDEDVNIVFTSDLVEHEELEKLDRVKIKTPLFNIELPPGFLDKYLNAGEVVFNIQKKRVEDSEIISVSLTIDDLPFKKLSSPIYLSVPYKGDAQDPEKVSAFYVDSNGEKEIIGGFYDSKEKRVKFLTSDLGKYFIREVEKKFADLDDIIWAKDAVEVMASKGVITGISEDRFEPNALITRGEFSALITRMLKLTNCDSKTLPFKDVKRDTWYYKPILNAYKNELIKGKDAGIFDPNGHITRQEMAKIISKVLLDKGYILAKENELTEFKDKSEIAPWAKHAVGLVVKEGIMTGISSDEFKPKDKVTRAQAAVMLYRLYKTVFE